MKRWALFQREDVLDRDGNDLYLRRWIIFRTPWAALYLHKFFQSDPDEFHDHPWSFITLPLRHGYVEDTLDSRTGQFSTEFRPPFVPKFLPSTSLHRVLIADNVNPWSLCLILNRHRDWGFMTDDGWVQHETFLKERRDRQHG